MASSETVDVITLDMSRVIGIWYTQMDDNLHCLALLFLDERDRMVMATCVGEQPMDISQVPWERSPLPATDQRVAIASMQFAQRRMMKLAGRERAWELLRGSCATEELVEALNRMPGIVLQRERING